MSVILMLCNYIVVEIAQEDRIMSNLSENLKNFRLLRGLSQADLAKIVHRSPNVISNWERGINSPDVEIVEQICKLFKVTPNMMYGWDESEELKEFLDEKAQMIREMDDMIKQKEELENRIKHYSEKISRRK